MKHAKFLTVIIAILLLSNVRFSTIPAHAQDPLPSWCPLPDAPQSSVEDLLPDLDLDGSTLALSPVDLAPIHYIYSPDTPPLALLSPDATQVALVRAVGDYQSELWLINTDDSGERLILDSETIARLNPFGDDNFHPRIGYFEWLDNETLIFNVALIYTGDGPFSGVPRDVWLLNTTSGELTELLPWGSGGPFFVSPDRQVTAIMTQDTLYFLDTETLELHPDRLPAYNTIPMGEVLGFPVVQWLPDSSAFLVAVFYKIDNLGTEMTVSIWQVPISSDPTLVLDTLSISEQGYRSFDISPDGQFFHYLRLRAGDTSSYEGVFSSIDGSENYVLFPPESNTRYWFLGWLPEFGHFRIDRYTDGEPTSFIGDVCGNLESFET